jgi:hypothetical protein
MMDTGKSFAVSAPHAHVRQRLDRTPWYRQFWPWFLIGLPAVSVVFSFATLFIALRDADSVIPHEGDSTSYAAPREPARPNLPDFAHVPGNPRQAPIFEKNRCLSRLSARRPK